MSDDGQDESHEDDYPIAAYLNYYSLTITVVKKSLIRIYDIEKG